MEEKQSYEDIDWLGKVEVGTIKKLLVKTLDKYFRQLLSMLDHKV